MALITRQLDPVCGGERMIPRADAARAVLHPTGDGKGQA